MHLVGHGTISSDGKLCLALSGTDAAHPDITGIECDRVRRALLYSPAHFNEAEMAAEFGHCRRAVDSTILADAVVISGHRDPAGLGRANSTRV